MRKSAIKKWVVLNKKRGETPLEAISAWKVEHPEYAKVPASYAGRLDPMAQGKLLVLFGDECKKQSLYTRLDKEYEIEVLLGFGTDTGDALGLATYQRGQENEWLEKFLNTNETFLTTHSPATAIHSALVREVGIYSRKYPAFSSKTVNGKPLFLYALEGKLDEIQIPEHIERMYKIKYEGMQELDTEQLRARMQKLLTNVPRSDEPSKLLGADFRQDEVRKRWNELFDAHPVETFTIIKLRVTCGTGAYMRTLAQRIGASLGTDALCLTINRTKLGKYVPLGPVGFWSKLYK